MLEWSFNRLLFWVICFGLTVSLLLGGCNSHEFDPPAEESTPPTSYSDDGILDGADEDREEKDVCINGETRTGTTPCGPANDGNLLQECLNDLWGDMELQNLTNCVGASEVCQSGETEEPGTCPIRDVQATITSYNTLVAAVVVTTNVQAAVAVRYRRAGSPYRWTNSTAVGRRHELTVVGMRAETIYQLQAVATIDGVKTYAPPIQIETGSLPGDIRDFSVVVYSAADVSPGFTLFSVDDGNGPSPEVAVDEEGDVVWYSFENGGDCDVKLMSSGDLLFCGHEVKRVSVGGEVKASIEYQPEFHHDATEVSGGFAALSTQLHPLNIPAFGGDVSIRSDRIIEMDWNGNFRWEWDAFDHMDTTRFPTQSSRTHWYAGEFYEWTHANSLTYIPENDTFMLSMRHQHWVILVSRLTSEVLWRLGADGDFELLSGEWFYGQHNPELFSDGRLLVYDNGTDRPNTEVPYSRAVMYQLDFEAMTATQIWEWRTEDFTAFIGGINLLENENVLVCAGGMINWSPDAPPPIARVTEVKGDRKVWELVAPGNIYRARRITSFYR